MRVVVTGVTRTGNLGGTAMLCAVEQVLGPDCEDFALASILPRQDRAQNGPDHSRVIAADYRYWMLVVAPLCVLLWPLRKLPGVRALLRRLPLLRDIASADAIADLSGIAFVDGRGLPLLIYNVAVVLPGLFFDVPVFKLSQATGPFRQKINRAFARWTFSRCRVVVARGATSLSHLHSLGINKAIFCPDTSFALDIPEAVRNAASSQIIERFGTTEGALIICSPSAVVQRRCAEAGIDMVAVFATAFSQMIEQGMRVALLPHASDTGIRKNDDYEVARRIATAGRGRGHEIVMLEPNGDPRLARALIGQADAFVATRFHSMIAALSQCVPTTTVGWSHKYAEAADPFGMTRFTIDYAGLNVERIGSMVAELLDNGPSRRLGMAAAAKEARLAAELGIRTVLGAQQR